MWLLVAAPDTQGWSKFMNQTRFKEEVYRRRSGEKKEVTGSPLVITLRSIKKGKKHERARVSISCMLSA